MTRLRFKLNVILLTLIISTSFASCNFNNKGEKFLFDISKSKTYQEYSNTINEYIDSLDEQSIEYLNSKLFRKQINITEEEESDLKLVRLEDDTIVMLETRKQYIIVYKIGRAHV